MRILLILLCLQSSWLVAQTVNVSHHWKFNEFGLIETMEWLPAFNERSQVEFFYESETLTPTDIVYQRFLNGALAFASNLSENINFDASGNLKEANSQDSSSYQTLFRYDDLGRIRKHIHKVNGQDEYRASQFEYDEWGNIARYYKDQGNPGWQEFAYTDQSMLQTFTFNGQGGVTYEYDKFGNMTHANGFQGSSLELPARPQRDFANNQNQNPAYQYDQAGRLIADEHHLYDYRKDGRLGAVRDLKTGWVIASYKYDANGNRVAAVNEEEVTYYSRDEAGEILYEKAYKQGRQVFFQEYHDHPGGKLVRAKSLETGEEKTMRYFANYQGTTVMRSTDGGPIDKFEYSPFGLQMQAGAQHDGSFGFTGHETDSETKQTYMRARYFNPDAGRFTKPDPALDYKTDRPATMNLYQYTYNNPINYTDPSGLAADDNYEDMEPAMTVVHEIDHEAWQPISQKELDDAPANDEEINPKTVEDQANMYARWAYAGIKENKDTDSDIRRFSPDNVSVNHIGTEGEAHNINTKAKRRENLKVASIALVGALATGGIAIPALGISAKSILLIGSVSVATADYSKESLKIGSLAFRKSDYIFNMSSRGVKTRVIAREVGKDKYDLYFETIMGHEFIGQSKFKNIPKNIVGFHAFQAKSRYNRLVYGSMGNMK